MHYGNDKRFKRAKLPMQVLRGFNPTEPTKLSSLAPPKADEEIYAGMVMVKEAGEFRIATSAEAASATSEGTSFYIALHDYDSHDVQASGGLVGLDCSDDYEIQTGYFDPDITWAVDLPVTVGDDGVLTEAVTAGHVILGYVTAVGAGTNNAIPYVGKTPSAEDTLVIQIKTSRNGQTKA